MSKSGRVSSWLFLATLSILDRTLNHIARLSRPLPSIPLLHQPPPSQAMRRPAPHALFMLLFRIFFRVRSAFASPTNTFNVFETGDELEEKPGSTGFWLKLLLSCGLVVTGGIFAGYGSRHLEYALLNSPVFFCPAG